MHKKIIIATYVLCMMFIGVYANGELSGGALNAQPDIDKKSMSDLNGTSLRFCNDASSVADSLRLYLSSAPGKSQKVCAIFFNNLERDVDFSVGFTEATKNNFDEGLCDNDMTNNSFSKLIREDYTKKIPVKAHSQIKKIFTIAIPKTTTGDIIGCLAYNVDSSYSKSTGAVFGVFVRKVAPIDITITGKVYQFGRWDDIKSDVGNIYTSNRTSILKGIAAILGLWIIITIIQISSKKEKPHKKK